MVLGITLFESGWCYVFYVQYAMAYLARVLRYWNNLLLSPPFSARNFGTIYCCQHPQFKSPKYAPDMVIRVVDFSSGGDKTRKIIFKNNNSKKKMS